MQQITALAENASTFFIELYIRCLSGYISLLRSKDKSMSPISFAPFFIWPDVCEPSRKHIGISNRSWILLLSSSDIYLLRNAAQDAELWAQIKMVIASKVGFYLNEKKGRKYTPSMHKMLWQWHFQFPSSWMKFYAFQALYINGTYESVGALQVKYRFKHIFR